MKQISRSFCYFISLLFLLLACSQSKPVKTLGPNEFMPLAVGNKWIYGKKPADYKYTMEIVSNDTINNKNYFRVKHSPFGKDSLYTFYYYQRISNDTLFVLYYDILSIDNLEFIDAIFSVNVSDTVCIYPGNILTDKCKEHIVITKKSEDQIEVFRNSTEAIDEERWITYERGIGIIMDHSVWGEKTELLYYEIVVIVEK